ncbi:MAG: ExbD/TolR family protein, partial [Pirellula sp.]
MSGSAIDQEEELEQVSFEKKELPKDDMDMTPMVDVTFLLLIFFMITANFTMQKSIQVPAEKSDEASSQA